jgi:pimeloyl-ACP methyl ester carboxylesterase
LAFGAAAAGWTIRNYTMQSAQLMARLLRGSRVVDTKSGPIEYGERGEGPVVLISHGGGGGYDQSLLVASLIGNGFRFVAPSRFGYLRTPLGEDNNLEAQADAYAALLDALDIPSAAILGTSAGGPSALYFALRHPERCWGLILVSAVNHNLPEATQKIMRRAEFFAQFLPDFSMLMIGDKMAGPALKALDPGLDVRCPVTMRILREFIYTATPLQTRLPGAKNDFKELIALNGFPFAEINTPAFVIHGEEDRFVPFDQGQTAAEEIPGAEFLPISGGSHYCIATHADITVPAIREFLFMTLKCETF